MVPNQGIPGGPPIPQAPPVPFSNILWLVAVLVALLVVAAVAVAVARRTLLGTARGADEEVFDTARLLAEYEQLVEQGQLSREEFARIRARLLGREQRAHGEAEQS